MTKIQPESVQSLFIEMYFGDTKLSTGTGFLATSPTGKHCLITNRHNVTCRRQDDGQPLFQHGGVPDNIVVWHNCVNGLGTWQALRYPLYENGQQLWFEHPTLGASADIVALKIEPHPIIKTYTYDLTEPLDGILVQASDPLSIIGFPFGKAAGGLFGIWVTGFLASEMVVDYDNKPIFLIDSRTRPGQSGSPVIAVRRGMITRKSGNIDVGANATEFLGIYSGRINEQSDLGFVWKRTAIIELLKTIK